MCHGTSELNTIRKNNMGTKSANRLFIRIKIHMVIQEWFKDLKFKICRFLHLFSVCSITELIYCRLHFKFYAIRKK